MNRPLNSFGRRACGGLSLALLLLACWPLTADEPANEVEGALPPAAAREPAPEVVAPQAAAPRDPAPAESAPSPSDIPPPADAPAADPAPDVVPAPSVTKGASPPANICTSYRVRPQDQLWAVSTRHLGCGWATVAPPAFQVWRYESGRWLPATLAEFYASDSPDQVTTLFIHGNRIDHWLAFQDGQNVYFQMAGKFDDERPVRFVIWSWPSSQIKGQLKDIRAKAWRTNVDGYYLARFLEGIRPDVQVGLIGYSYGARIVTGGLHLLGGGSLAGRTVPPGPRPQIRVALWAAALHNHWLLPGHYHGQALGMAERWLITYNCCDPVLSRYRWLEKHSDPVALGYSGFYGRNLLSADLQNRIEQMNVSGLVGGTHDMDPYLYSWPIQNRTREYVLWHELDFASTTLPALAAAGK